MLDIYTRPMHSESNGVFIIVMGILPCDEGARAAWAFHYINSIGGASAAWAFHYIKTTADFAVQLKGRIAIVYILSVSFDV